MKINIVKNLLFIDIALGLLVLYLIFFNYSHLILLISDNYLPVWSDEYFYFINADSYIQNNTLQAALTYSGKGSVIFSSDAHGFAYSLLHGIVAYFFDWTNLSFIYLNFALIVVAILLISFLKPLTISQKIWISCLILLYPFFQLYGFTYMQESIHVFIAIVLSILLYKLYEKEENSLYVWLFIGVIFIGSFFRSLWFFWLIGLIPLADSKREYKKYGIIFFLGVLLSFLFTKMFTESIPNYFSSLLVLLENGDVWGFLVSLVTHFFENIKFYFSIKNFNSVYDTIKYINIGVVFYFVFDAIKNKNRLSKAISLIGAVNFLLLFFLYDAFGGREIRTMSPLFYFSIIFIVTGVKNYLRYPIIASVFVLFVLNLDTTKEWILERNRINLNSPQNLHRKAAFDQIAKELKESSTILLNYTPRDYSLDLFGLPLKTSNGAPLRYIVPYYQVEIGDYDYHIIRPNRAGINNKIIDNRYYILSKKK